RGEGPGGGEPQVPTTRLLHGYDRLSDGVRVRAGVAFTSALVEAEETLRIVRDRASGRLVRALRLTGIPDGRAVLLRSRAPASAGFTATAEAGTVETRAEGGVVVGRPGPHPPRAPGPGLHPPLPPPPPPPP